MGQEFGPPASYYDPANALTGIPLKTALHDIIDNHTVRSYDDLKLAVRALDQDPDNPNNIILLYSGESFPGSQFGASGEVWNREHVWPQSYGVDGEDYNTVGFSDFHHLFPALASVNGDRLNRYFDYTDPGDYSSVPRAPGSSYDTNSFEPRDEDKGRIARALLYMAVRYEGLDDEKRTSSTALETPNLILGDRPNSGFETMGKLTVLLEWNRMYAPDEREQKRNHGIYEGVQWGTRTYKQGNRNPFIDHPEYADSIYRSNAYVTYGTWRVQHFNHGELDVDAISGDLADPDGDRMVNLVELSANLNPGTIDSEVPFQVIDEGDGTVTIRFVQLRQADISGLEYLVQSSTDPWSVESWSAVDGSVATETRDDWTLTSSLTDQPASPGDTFYRLRVNRSYPVDNPGEAILDPARLTAEPGSIFAYDPSPAQGWRVAEWLSTTYTPEFPWIHQRVHNWLWILAATPDSVWIFDEYLGWFWTSRAVYPIAYFPDQENWLQFDLAYQEPQRQLTFVESGERVNESEL